MRYEAAEDATNELVARMAAHGRKINLIEALNDIADSVKRMADDLRAEYDREVHGR